MTRGNPNLNNNALERRNNTLSLIRQASKQLDELFIIKSIPNISMKTKEIDSKSKGVSEASFRNKELAHIQSLMIELGIGKYEAINVSSTEAEREIADELIETKKELARKNTELKKAKEKNKKLAHKIDALGIDNEELRTANYEFNLRYKMRLNISPINNRN